MCHTSCSYFEAPCSGHWLERAAYISVAPSSYYLSIRKTIRGSYIFVPVQAPFAFNRYNNPTGRFDWYHGLLVLRNPFELKGLTARPQLNPRPHESSEWTRKHRPPRCWRKRQRGKTYTMRETYPEGSVHLRRHKFTLPTNSCSCQTGSLTGSGELMSHAVSFSEM